MNYTTQNDVVLDNSTQKFQWGRAISGSEYPLLVSVNMPKDFSQIAASQGANQTSEDAYNVITWNIQPYENSDCAVEFLPFPTQPTLTSMRITAQAMSNSANSAIKMTYNESYNINGSFLIWNFLLVMPITIPFPANTTTNSDVQSVTDGVNECTEQPSPLASGTYLIDHKNNDVEILPRDTYQNNVSERFDVQVVFMVPNGLGNERIKANIPFYKPYENAAIMIFNVSNFGILKPNLELFQMNIMLPSGVDQVQSQTGTPMLQGSVDTGITVIWNYVESTNIPSYWIVTFEQPPLRNFFYQQLDTLFLFAAPFLISIGLYIYTRKMKIKIVGLSYFFSLSDGAVTGYLVLRVIDSCTAYQSFNGLNLWYTLFLVFELIFLVVAILLFAHPLIQKVRSGQPSVEDKAPNDEKPTNINHENNDENKQKVSEATNTDNQDRTPTK
jgi:hypothetical protein